ncbi:hypothetical protein CAPTEDRAFT_176799 [Capitella teleta]|uniref:Sulfatase N-terminal domain-containing protein n=1 Tax=Capitella teleta TaxID=283909 RepID=R7U6G2_CAPTE|nr:hypothetical protein CAPTEDRAFT_176799 [Capitella teleta]|eukprot:ELU01579.1 hypothetical protein CAPTEDRAFT_176799 [Capitella teleta]
MGIDAKPPNILFIMSDDYGWHDIGYHGSKIRTPVLDDLAYNGIRLENYYVQPICSPTRSQFMSGVYQIHTGLQHNVIWPAQANGLPLEFPTIADKMREAGYATHMAGKWHLGYYKEEYLPHNRGFDTYYGYLNGCEDYYDKSYCHPYCGYDFRLNDDIQWNLTDYSTYLYVSRVNEILLNHKIYSPDKPLFLYLPLQSVHEPLEVPKEYSDKYSHIKDNNRRTYAGMVAAMDEAVGKIRDLFKKYEMWDETVLAFSTDNGGQIHRGGNNWPLRGWKISLWEGGMRGVGFVHSPLLPNSGGKSKGLMHVSDWLPTLVHVAGGNTTGMKLDGYNVWDMLTKGTESPRKEILHNIDPLMEPKGHARPNSTFDTRVRAAIRYGDWKLITGDPGNGSWIPPPEDSTQGIMDTSGKEQNFWLFNVDADPNETNDLSAVYPQIVDQLLERLCQYNATSVPVRFPPLEPESNPAFHGGAFGPWK